MLDRVSAPDYEMVRICRACRLCHQERLQRVLSLAEVPIVSPNTGGPNLRYAAFTAPLDNYLCTECGHIQLGHVVPPDLLYSDYLYRTSISLGLAEHFRGLSAAVIDRTKLQSGDLVLEFGSNDGTLLKHFQDAGMTVQGIDPAHDIAAAATTRGIPTAAAFFDRQTASLWKGKAKAVLANNVMANIDDLSSVLDAVKIALAPDGVFVFETQYALDVYEKTLLDVIYHEHVSIFSVLPIVKGFRAVGVEVFDVERIPTKGGSIRVWVRLPNSARYQMPASVWEMIDLEHRTGLFTPGYFERFKNKVDAIRTDLHSAIAAAKEGGGKIAAYGTSVGSIALIHQFGLQGSLDFLLDDNPLKDHIAGPGYDFPVYTGEAVSVENPALIIILAWRYADAIMSKHPDYSGRFIVPLR